VEDNGPSGIRRDILQADHLEDEHDLARAEGGGLGNRELYDVVRGILVERVANGIGQDRNAGHLARVFRRRDSAGRWSNCATGGAFANAIDGCHFVLDGLAGRDGVCEFVGADRDILDEHERATVGAAVDVVARDGRAVVVWGGP
jgi:hypothetical protein